MQNMLRVFVFYALPILVAPTVAAEKSFCDAVLHRWDTKIERQNARDYQADQVAGYPWLRVTRWALSQAKRGVSDNVLLPLLLEEGKKAYRVELKNINASELDVQSVLACMDGLAAQLLASKPQFKRMRDGLKVRSDYIAGHKIFGLYPLTVLPTKIAIANDHETTHGRFKQLANQPLDASRYRHYIPILTSNDFVNDNDVPSALIDRHAPTFIVEQKRDADLLGKVIWGSSPNRRPEIDTRKPTVYVSTSRTWWAGQAHRQIIYSIWFSERESDGVLDILAGHLSGLIWRVTVNAAGEAVFYDSIHQCGCYQQFFPTTHDIKANATGFWEEYTLVPEIVPVKNGRDLGVVLASNSHYIAGIHRVADVAGYGANANHHVYRFANYNELRSLPTGSKKQPYRSIFGADGIIESSERPEQHLLWPLGVPAAGAMRQWGRHATAFVGERYFDDPWLFEYTFGDRERIPKAEIHWQPHVKSMRR